MVDGMSIMDKAREGDHLGTEATSHLIPPLQDQNLEPCFGQVTSRGEPIRSTTNDDAIILRHGSLSFLEIFVGNR
jgi:hypothetical protein